MGRTERIRLLVLDNNPIVACGLVALCEREEDLEVGCCVRTAHEAVLALEREPYDVLVMDLTLPDRLGLDLVHTVHRRWPHVSVLVFSGEEERLYALRAIRAGARGYLPKSGEIPELLHAIRLIVQGEHFVTSVLSELLAREVSGVEQDDISTSLSDREFEVFRLLAQGRGVQQIAGELCLSRQTVTTYRRRVLDKLELEGNEALVDFAVRHQLV